MSFEKELETLINRYSLENGSNTPDFILAKYLVHCLRTFESIVTRREEWYGRGPEECSAPSFEPEQACDPLEVRHDPTPLALSNVADIEDDLGDIEYDDYAPNPDAGC